MNDELRREIKDLRASRGRLAVARDAERRLIERDLHDGPQQHLVALAVKLQLARQLADTDPPKLKALLDEIAVDVREALDSLRNLAYGVYPALLIARGLGDALGTAASEAGIPTRAEVTGLDRYPADVEAAVYFCCLEALQNAARHAGADARARVRAWHERDALSFEVADDGVGFETTTARDGAGLHDMGDRVAAVGGTLSISSEPGRGTCVSGAIPLS